MPPLLFVFENILNYCFEYFPEEDPLLYNEKLQSEWLLFWTKEGEAIVQTTWLKKYSEYILNENEEEKNENLDEACDEKIKDSVDQCTIEQESSTKTKEITSEADAYSYLWQDLWNKHYTETYEKTYQLFSEVHQHHYNFYRLPSEEVLLDDLSAYPLEEDENELEYLDQTEQLQALGLPTSFGGSNSKYHKNRLQDLSSDSLSEEETEEDHEMAPVHQTSSQKPAPTIKKKKKNRKLKKIPKFIVEDKSLRSYWHKRFSLFSRFDEGIKLDRESWFSVTPEKVAIHMADRLRCDTIIDAFCGSGGNSIQFARTCNRVIAIDIDPEKIKNARHNASIYGMANKIEFIIGDYLQLSGSLKGDVVFLSPPWGGPKYISQKEYNIEESLAPLGASDLADKSRLISENIAFFLPKNSNPQQIAKVAGVGNRVEVEHNYLNTRLVGLTAIYGDWLIDKKNL
ncbi:trimethylguanosine synthase [Eupeodes corollae]|uniref:trimethylguanosine synthase n=1 Tax=Eupeodes corollae TaxID=290404 RepID=UPI0024911BEA|nr:trimethylguanosine synthase [Eupeodes corollae]